MIFENMARYEVMVLGGVVMAVLVLGKLIGYYNISSDWFWFIAALALAVEGGIYLVNQRRFDSKYKVLTKEEYEKLMRKK
jgi:hypothetical protein